MTLWNNFAVTKKFFITKFDCSIVRILIGKFKIILKCASLQVLNICDHRTTTTKIKIFFLILQKVFVCFTKTYRIITYAMQVVLRMGTLGKLRKVTVSIVVNIHPEILKLWFFFQSQPYKCKMIRS